MDNYANNMYLSQDGYPSIDFTLLDRPSSSMVSARESVLPFPQGDSSFPSFNLFDGAGAVSYNNQSIADHGSRVLEAHKNVMRREASGAFVSLPNQSEGVHDFFEQGNQLKSDSGTGHRNEQSAYFLSRVASADERLQKTLHTKNTYEAFQCDNTEQPNREARMPHASASVGFLQSMAEESMDRSRSMNVPLSVQNESRNQAFSPQGVFKSPLSVQQESRNQAFCPQGVLNFPPSNNFGSSNSVPFKSGLPSHQPSTDNTSYFGAQYQNQVDSYDVSSSQTRAMLNNTPSYDFLGNQMPWKGAIQHSQAAASKQLQGFTKTAGPPELQPRQLQEMLLEHHLTQLENTRQEQISQQAPNHFLGTSYSDLLHKPDTPPQQQTTEEYENHPHILPSQNAEAVGWSVDGPLYYQGVVNNLHVEQNQNLQSQISAYKEAVDSGGHLGNLKDQNGLTLASYTVGHAVPGYVDGKWKLQQVGKPALHGGSQNLTETRTTDFGLANDWNSELRKSNQPHAQLGATQNSSGESISRQKVVDLSLVNAFSQSQQHFQELQFAEQRNFFSEPKQPVSSPNLNLLPHQSFNHANSNSKNVMQQRSNGFTTMDNYAGYMPQNSPNTPLDVAAASGQPQWLTSSSPSKLTSGDVRGPHQANAWEGLQARETGFNLEPASYAKYSVLSNSNPQQLPQQGAPTLGVLPGPIEASIVRQQGLFNTQVNGVNVKASVVGTGSVSNQQVFMSSQDYRKEGGGANMSNSRVQPLSEPASQFQGAWKKYTPPNQFLPGGGSLGQQSLEGPGLRHGFQHQGYEASFHTPAMSNNLNNTSVQYVSNQLVHEEQLPPKNSQLLEKHVSHDHTASLPTANLMKTVSRHAMKVVPDVMEENQGGFYRSVEPQDIFVERQQEVPQQQVNSCTASVSLAHLRGNQSSSSQSPHVRLGLGPSHDLQHPTDASWKSSSNQSPHGEVPPLKLAHKTLSAESPHRSAGFETTGKDETEVNQGSSVSIKRMVSQSSGASASGFNNKAPPPLRGTALSDTSPTSSFASGYAMRGTSYVSASTVSYSNEYNAARDPTQTRDKVRGGLSSGVSQTQTSALNCASHQDALNGYIGKTSCISNYSRLPNHSAGAQPMQKKHVVDSSTEPDNDGGRMYTMQDHNLNNIPPSQVGNRLNAMEHKDLATDSKASVFEHSNFIVNNEKQYPGILESYCMPSSSACGVDGDHKRDTAQRAAMMRNTNNWRGEEHSVQASSIQYGYNDQLSAYTATQSCNEASGLMRSPNVQGESHHSLTPVNDGLSDLLQARRSQDSNKYQHANSLDSPALGFKAAGRNSRKPPLRAPSSVIGSGMQPSSHEDLRQRQDFTGLQPSTRTERSPEAAILPLPESNKPLLYHGKSSAEPIRPVSWSVNQHAGNVQLSTTEDSVSSLDALQQHSVSVSETKSHNIPQPAKSQSIAQLAGTFEHSQSLKELGKFHQTIPYPIVSNHHSLTSAGFKPTNLRASRKSTFLPQQSAGNKETSVISIDSQVPVVLDSSTTKDEGVLTPIQGPVSTPKNEGDLSSLKVITPGEVAPPSKKRKKQLPLLIPWHSAAAQPSINLPSNSDAEMMWATALNRVPEKDFNAAHEDNTSNVFRAKRRLILTTESMQRLVPPLPDGLMHGTMFAERECGIYSLAKLALEDACSLVAKSKGQTGLAQTCLTTKTTSSRGQVCDMADTSVFTKCVESFMGRVKQLGMELARLDCSTSVSEVQGETHELEKLSIVNRLAKHHGIGFTMDSSDNLFIENILDFRMGARKPPPQKYVTAAAMPRKLPEGVRCLSL